jgi:CHAT domain
MTVCTLCPEFVAGACGVPEMTVDVLYEFSKENEFRVALDRSGRMIRCFRVKARRMSSKHAQRAAEWIDILTDTSHRSLELVDYTSRSNNHRQFAIGLAKKIRSNAAFIVWSKEDYTEVLTRDLNIPIYDRHRARAFMRGRNSASEDDRGGTEGGVAPMDKIRVLFVSANPIGTPQLKLDEEVREIQTKIRSTKYRDALTLETIWATRPDDLLQALNEHKPHVVHFSGHGSPTEEIILLDRFGKAKAVSKGALVDLFRVLKDNIRLVILNACFSRPQAEAIVQTIDCAVGMGREIGDDAAITFAASFYRALGFGRSVDQAFDQGKVALQLEGMPEDLTPQLLCRRGVDPSSIVLISPP